MDLLSLIEHTDMSVCTGYLGKEIAILGASEEITSLSRALSQFAELQVCTPSFNLMCVYQYVVVAVNHIL